VSALRILRLTDSNDSRSSLPEPLRASAIAEATAAELTGEQIETIVRPIWPSPELPGILSGWMARFEPDVVFLRTPTYWVSFESVPLRIRRRLGRFGEWPADVGLKVGGHPRFAESRLGHGVAALALRTIGGDTHFTPGEACERVESLLKVVLGHESAVTVVRGPSYSMASPGDSRASVRAFRRNHEFNTLLAGLCTRLHVEFASAATPTDDLSLRAADGLHTNEHGQRVTGELEGRAIAAAWQGASSRR